ncbi:Nanos -like protein 1 [Halotydeus destructor]|nr:Nanos -like protein 1 [Halotydeus destructor]
MSSFRTVEDLHTSEDDFVDRFSNLTVQDDGPKVQAPIGSGRPVIPLRRTSEDMSSANMLMKNLQALASVSIQNGGFVNEKETVLEQFFRWKQSRNKPTKFCGFCRTNGETMENCSSHSLKDASGKVTCPILSRHVCELCGATGPEAHTRSHCPFAQVVRDIPSLVDDKDRSNFFSHAELKKTRRNSAGKVRRFGFQPGHGR